MKTIIIMSLFFACILPHFAGAETILPPMADIDDQVALSARLAGKIRNYCNEYRSINDSYTHFKDGAKAGDDLGKQVQDKARYDVRAERYGAQAEAAWAATNAAVPSGFNPMVCTGTFPEIGGSIRMSADEMLSSQSITADATLDLTFSGSKLYPVGVTMTRGDRNILSGTKKDKNSPFVVNSVSLQFLQFNGLSNTWNVGVGQYNIGENNLVDFFNRIEEDCLIWGQYGNEKHCMSVAGVFRQLANTDFQTTFIDEFKNFMFREIRFKNYAKIKDKGIKAFQEGRNSEAIRYLKNAVEYSKETLDKSDGNIDALLLYEHALMNLGIVYFKAGDYSNARLYYGQAIDSISKRPLRALYRTYYNDMANIYAHLGENDKATDMRNQAASCPAAD